MRKYVLIFAFIFFIALAGAIVFGYDNVITHPTLTGKALEIYENQFGKKFTEAQKEWIKKGSVNEDDTPRYLNHFYDPSTGRGLNDGWVMYGGKWMLKVKGMSAIDWAFNQDGSVTGDFSIPKILENYQYGNFQRAYEGIGHIAHLVQDMSVPAHTRNDQHSDGDPYELWVRDNGKIDNISVSEIPNVDIKSIFYQLAKYSNGGFLSKDTVFNLNLTQNTFFKIEDNNANEAIKYFYKTINNISYKIISIDPFDPKAKLTIEDPFIHSDYFRVLSPQAVKYTLSVFQYFQQEFDRIDAEKMQKALSLWQKVKFAFANMDNNVAYVIGDAGGAVEVGTAKAMPVVKQATLDAIAMLVQTATAVKNFAVETAIAAKNFVVDTAIVVKDFVVDTSIAIKDWTVDTAVAAGDLTMAVMNKISAETSSFFSSVSSMFSSVDVKYQLAGVAGSNGGSSQSLVVSSQTETETDTETNINTDTDTSANTETGFEVNNDTAQQIQQTPEQSNQEKIAALQKQLQDAKDMLAKLQEEKIKMGSSQVSVVSSQTGGGQTGTQNQALAPISYVGLGGGKPVISNQILVASSQTDTTDNATVTVATTTVVVINDVDDSDDDTATTTDATEESDLIPPSFTLAVEGCADLFENPSCVLAATTVNFSWTSTSTDLAYFNIDNNGAFSTTTATTTTVVVADGAETSFGASAVDLAGNVSATSTANVAVVLPVVDVTPPVISGVYFPDCKDFQVGLTGCVLQMDSFNPNSDSPLTINFAWTSNDTDIDYYEVKDNEAMNDNGDIVSVTSTTTPTTVVVGMIVQEPEYSRAKNGYSNNGESFADKIYSFFFPTAHAMAMIQDSYRYKYFANVSVRARDTSGNWSEWFSAYQNIYYLPVVINEVAWAGTEASSADEWIELYNPTDENIDLSGWVLRSEENSPYIKLSGSIAPNSYYLMERKDDSVVGDISADLIYGNDGTRWALNGSASSQTGELLFLEYALSGNATTTVDKTVLKDNDEWPNGINNTTSYFGYDEFGNNNVFLYATMERMNASMRGDVLDNWYASCENGANGLDKNGNPIMGTPRQRNNVECVMRE